MSSLIQRGFAVLLAFVISAGLAHGAPMLLGGFVGNQTQNTIGVAITSVTGVRELVGAKQSTEAVGLITTRIWTDQTTNKELQWNVNNQSTTNGKWGTSTFTPAASTNSEPWVATQGAASWINFEIFNAGTVEVALDKFHVSVKRTTINASTGLTISLQQNGTFANPPVLSASALTATGSKDIDITAHTVNTWGHYEFSFSSMLSDLTLAAGQKATFRIANNVGTDRLYLDNIAISGAVVPPAGTMFLME